MNGRSYVRNPLRSNAILNIENIDEYCFYWSILASLHPCNNNDPTTVTNYKHYSNEMNIDGFDFTNGIKGSDVHKFEKLNNLSINFSELNFYQDQSKWIHKIVPIEVSKNGSDRVMNLLI